MKKRWILIIALVVIFLIFFISFLNEYRIMKKQQEKYYDWQMRMTFWCRADYDRAIQEIQNYLKSEEYKIQEIYNPKHPTGGRLGGSAEIKLLTTLNGKLNLVKTNWIDDINHKINATWADGTYAEAIHSVTFYWERIIDSNITQKIPKDENELISCEIDSDCISVADGCCGCNYGGKAKAINVAYADYWKNKTSETCKNIGCPAVISNDPTCYAEPRCMATNVFLFIKERKCELPLEKDPEIEKLKHCGTDEDCVKVKIDCCNYTAINKNYLDQWKGKTRSLIFCPLKLPKCDLVQSRFYDISVPICDQKLKKCSLTQTYESYPRIEVEKVEDNLFYPGFLDVPSGQLFNFTYDCSVQNDSFVCAGKATYVYCEPGGLCGVNGPVMQMTCVDAKSNCIISDTTQPLLGLTSITVRFQESVSYKLSCPITESPMKVYLRVVHGSKTDVGLTSSDSTRPPLCSQ